LGQVRFTGDWAHDQTLIIVRYVLDDLLLKDTDENSVLQQELLVERSVDGSLVEDPDDGEIQFTSFKMEADDNVSEADTDTMAEPASSPKMNLVEELQEVKVDYMKPEDYSIEVIPLPLSEGIIRKFEQDTRMIITKKKLVKLSAQSNIVTLLDMFVRTYAIQRLAQLEKQLGKSQYRMTAKKKRNVINKTHQ
jgi:hypothetical protein